MGVAIGSRNADEPLAVPPAVVASTTSFAVLQADACRQDARCESAQNVVTEGSSWRAPGRRALRYRRIAASASEASHVTTALRRPARPSGAPTVRSAPWFLRGWPTSQEAPACRPTRVSACAHDLETRRARTEEEPPPRSGTPKGVPARYLMPPAPGPESRSRVGSTKDSLPNRFWTA